MGYLACEFALKATFLGGDSGFCISPKSSHDEYEAAGASDEDEAEEALSHDDVRSLIPFFLGRSTENSATPSGNLTGPGAMRTEGDWVKISETGLSISPLKTAIAFVRRLKQ